MRKIVLSGRERSVIRTIGFALPVEAAELAAAVRIETAELVDVLNGMLEAGFIETTPAADRIGVDTFAAHSYEVNPGYAQQLREALARHH